MRAADTALALAGQLRALGDQDLAELIRARGVRPAGIADFFDLADALTDPESVQAALVALDRPTLATLAALAEAGTASVTDLRDRLTALGAPGAHRVADYLAAAARLALAFDVDRVHAVPSAVAARLQSWPEQGLPSLAELVAPPPSGLEALGDVDAAAVDRVASERAFTTTTRVAELVAALDHAPARELARGGIALPDAKRLAAAVGVGLDDVPGVIRTAERAGLLGIETGMLLPTASSAAWLESPWPQRWARLAGGWADRLSPDLRAVLRPRARAPWGDGLAQFLRWLYPADESLPGRARASARDAEALGIVADGTPSTPGAALLEHGAERAAEAMRGLFPPTVDRVFVQHDLTIVSPGPLEPSLDARLRTMADVEARSLAATYRVSTASLNRALAGGDTADGIRAFLAGLSLTGVPQPLEYLIADAAARFGLVRVSEAGGGSRVRSADATLLRTIAVDSALAGLGLVPSGDALASRLAVDTVFWALSDAKYPVAAEDSEGTIVVLRQHRAQTSGRTGMSGPDPIAELVERLRLTAPGDPEVARTAWLARQLDAAVRARQTLAVVVRMPDGSTAEFELEPASVAGGRLRARDRLRDLERTLPLSSIVSVAPST